MHLLQYEVNALRKLAPVSKVGQDSGTSGLGKDKVLYGTKSGKGGKSKK